MRVPLIVRMVAPVVGVSIMLLTVGLVTAWYVERLQQNAAAVLAERREYSGGGGAGDWVA